MSEDWREEAGCKGVNTSVFFVHESDPNASELPAKAICWRCPVKDICLEYALLHEDHGIFGGLNAKERRRMAAARQIKTQGRMWHGSHQAVRHHKRDGERLCALCLRFQADEKARRQRLKGEA